MRTFFIISSITGGLIILSILYLSWWLVLNEFLTFIHKERFKGNLSYWRSEIGLLGTESDEQISRMAWHKAHISARKRLGDFYILRFYDQIKELVRQYKKQCSGFIKIGLKRLV